MPVWIDQGEVCLEVAMFLMPCECGITWRCTRKTIRKDDRFCRDERGNGCGRPLPPPRPDASHIEQVGALASTLQPGEVWDYQVSACNNFHGYSGEPICRRCFWPEDAHPGQPVHRPPIVVNLGKETTSPMRLLLDGLEGLLATVKTAKAKLAKIEAERAAGQVNLFDF